MRSLFVSRWAPDARDGGAALRNAQNVAAIRALGPVDVLSVGPPSAQETAEGIRHWVHVEARAPKRAFPAQGVLPGRHPMIDRYRPPEAEQALARLLAEHSYDLAVVEELSLVSHMSPIRKAGVRCVFDAHNVEARLRTSLSDRRSGTLRKTASALLHARRLEAIERSAVHRADVVWACSREDAAALSDEYRVGTKVYVVPNTIDLDRFVDVRARQIAGPSPSEPISLLYTGTYSYRPNEEAALEIMSEVLPRLRACGHRVRLHLVGRAPTEAMAHLARTDPDVRITGAVHDVLPFYSSPAVVVLPIRSGSGTRLKIVEALAAGTPIVSTAKGAEGLDVRDRHDIQIAETPEAFVQAIIGIWSDAQAWRRQTAHAVETATRLYSWQAAAAAIYASLGCSASSVTE